MSADLERESQPAAYADDLLSALRSGGLMADEGSPVPDDADVLEALRSSETDTVHDRIDGGDLQLDKVLQQLVAGHTAAGERDLQALPAPMPAPLHKPGPPTTELAPVALSAVVEEPSAPREVRAMPFWGLVLMVASAEIVTWLFLPGDAAMTSRLERASTAATLQATATTARPPIAAAGIPIIAPAAPGRGPALVPPPATTVKPVSVGFATNRRVVMPESTRFIMIKVRSTGQLHAPIQLSVRTVDGAARTNEDFVPPAGKLVLTRERPSADVLVSLLSDSLRENVEDFSVVLELEQGRATLGTRSVVVVLTDDD